jgi:hypothetical protein
MKYFRKMSRKIKRKLSHDKPMATYNSISATLYRQLDNRDRYNAYLRRLQKHEQLDA